MGAFLLLILLALVYWFGRRRGWWRPRRPIRQGDLVQIKAIHQVDRDLPLGNLAVVYKTDSRGIYVVFPKLTSRGAVSYVDRRYDSSAVQFPTIATLTKTQQEQYRKIELIAPLIKSQFQLEPETQKLQKLHRELAELRQLAATSPSQTQQVTQLNQALDEVEQWQAQTQQYQQAGLDYIREILIANELAELEFDSSDALTRLLDQYGTLLQTGERLHDLAAAYRRKFL
ncbi:MAG: hypothetical protein ACKO7W_18025 [Elainella sp.]